MGRADRTFGAAIAVADDVEHRLALQAYSPERRALRIDFRWR